MEYFLVRYDSRVVNYDRRGFIRLATGLKEFPMSYSVITSAATFTLRVHTYNGSLTSHKDGYCMLWQFLKFSNNFRTFLFSLLCSGQFR